MDRFQAQLTALEYFFLNRNNEVDTLEKMEVTSVDYHPIKDLWEIKYNCIYTNKSVISVHELIDNEDEDYMIESLSLYTDHSGLKLVLI